MQRYQKARPDGTACENADSAFKVALGNVPPPLTPSCFQDWCSRSFAKLRMVKSLCNLAAGRRGLLLEMRHFWAASRVLVNGDGRALHRLAHSIHASRASATALLPVTPSKPLLILLEDPWEYSRDLGENHVSSHKKQAQLF